MRCRAFVFVEVLALALAYLYEQSAAINDLEDLLHVLAQRQHLNPRPQLLPFIVNPFSPLLLCDHHYGTEREPDPDIAFNQLYDNTTHTIQPCATVCVNSKDFEAFVIIYRSHI